MQYGALTSLQQAIFILKQKSFIRKPTFVVWVEGFGDTTEYVMRIDTETGLESLRGRGNLNIGRAILELNNKNGYFYSDGMSKVKNCARIKIWAGFDYFNIPIFTGTVDNVKPAGTQNTVTINCRDYMGLFFDFVIKDDLGLNNTPKSILEYLCSKVGVMANIANTEEFTMAYDEPNHGLAVCENQKIMSAIENICDSIFCVAYFDENGILQLVEREYSNLVPPTNGRTDPKDWRFDDSNIINCTLLADSEIINDTTIEYRNGFFARCIDQASIDEYRSKARQLRILSLNSDLVSSQTQGTMQEILDHNLEGFKLTSTDGSSIIDSIQIRMKKSDAHGYVCVRIYTDNDGTPGNLIGTSNLKASDNFTNEFTWEVFCFDTPIKVSPLTDYWCIIDTGSIDNGSVSIQINNATVNGKHTYYDSSSWHLENDKHLLHIIMGSRQAYRVVGDIVRFYRKPHERIKIIAPAVPYLQLTDMVKVNIKKMGIVGRYVIERRSHVLTSEAYTTIDTLRKVG